MVFQTMYLGHKFCSRLCRSVGSFPKHLALTLVTRMKNLERVPHKFGEPAEAGMVDKMPSRITQMMILSVAHVAGIGLAGEEIGLLWNFICRLIFSGGAGRGKILKLSSAKRNRGPREVKLT